VTPNLSPPKPPSAAPPRRLFSPILTSEELNKTRNPPVLSLHDSKHHQRQPHFRLAPTMASDQHQQRHLRLTLPISGFDSIYLSCAQVDMCKQVLLLILYSLSNLKLKLTFGSSFAAASTTPITFYM
jgi:hypothetical protein